MWLEAGREDLMLLNEASRNRRLAGGGKSGNIVRRLWETFRVSRCCIDDKALRVERLLFDKSKCCRWGKSSMP